MAGSRWEGMEDTPRWGRWKVAALALLVVALAFGALAVSCSDDGGVTASTGADPSHSRGPSRQDVAALTDREPSTTAASTTTADPATTTSSSGGSGSEDPADAGGPDETHGGGRAGAPRSPSGGPSAEPTVAPLAEGDCAALELVVIPAAAIITEADFVPLDQRPPDGGAAARTAAVQRIAAIAPATERPAWRAVAASQAQAQAAGRPLTEREVAAFRSARNTTEVWARSACPDAPPSWRCDDFGSIGPGPDVAPIRAEASSPDAVLRRYPDTGRAEEIQRTADIVLFGWVTDEGFVTRTHQVERIGGGWATSRRHVCHGPT